MSGFPFENYLGQIKRLLRKLHNPLQQLVKRLSEISLVNVPSPTDETKLHNLHTNGPLPHSLSSAQQYTKVTTCLFTLSTRHGDNCVAVGEDILLVENIVQIKGISTCCSEGSNTYSHIRHIPVSHHTWGYTGSVSYMTTWV